jgi:hypothetical protein
MSSNQEVKGSAALLPQSEDQQRLSLTVLCDTLKAFQIPCDPPLIIKIERAANKREGVH